MKTLEELEERAAKLGWGPGPIREIASDTQTLIRDLLEYARQEHKQLLNTRRMYCERMVALYDPERRKIYRRHVATEEGWDPAELWPKDGGVK